MFARKLQRALRELQSLASDFELVKKDGTPDDVDC